MGGLHTIRIENITILPGKKSFANWFEALFYFDAMVTGISTTKHAPEMNKEHKQILDHVRDHQLKRVECKESQHNYIHSAFNLYANHRMQLIINLYQLHQYFGDFRHYLIASMDDSWDCIDEDCGQQGISFNIHEYGFAVLWVMIVFIIVLFCSLKLEENLKNFITEAFSRPLDTEQVNKFETEQLLIIKGLFYIELVLLYLCII